MPVLAAGMDGEKGLAKRVFEIALSDSIGTDTIRPVNCVHIAIVSAFDEAHMDDGHGLQDAADHLDYVIKQLQIFQSNLMEMINA